MSQAAEVGILKSLWGKSADGRWAITDLHAVELHPAPGCDPDYFTIANRMEMMSKNPKGRTMGSTNFVLKQSIMPVVALEAGAPVLRVIGTAFVISASGLVMTAGHVLLDPEESGYGDVTNDSGAVRFGQNLQIGVLFLYTPPSMASGKCSSHRSSSVRFGEAGNRAR